MVALVQHAQNSTGSGSSLSTTVSSTTSGNCLVVCITLSNSSSFTVSTVKLGASSDNFSQAVSNTGRSGAPNIFIWVDPNCAGSGTSVVVTPSSTCAIVVDVFEFSGVATSSPVDKTSSGSGTSTSWSSGATATTTLATEAWVGCGAVHYGSGTPTLTGPSSPWTNETQQAVGDFGKLGVVNQISGYQVTSSTGAATYSGSADFTTGYAAAVVTLKSGAVTSTGAMTLKPSMAASGLGGNTTTTGAVTLRPSVAGTDIETFTATGAMTLRPAMAGSIAQGFPFPQVPQGLLIEVLLNGTWTDISRYVYQRADITIQRGKPNETTGMTPCQMTMTLNNRDGRFTPSNTSGAYYPYVGRNTQVRVSAQTDSIYYALAYRFWGEVSQWPPQWDNTGRDVYVQVTAAGWLRRLQQGAKLGSTLYDYITSLTGSGAPVAYWPCTDASGATVFASGLPGGSTMTWTGSPSLSSDTSFGGSDAIPHLSGSAWTGSMTGGVPGSPAVFDTPGTYTFTGPGGITTLDAVQAWGGGSGGNFVTCVTLDTEILTRRGWRSHNQVRPGDWCMSAGQKWSRITRVRHGDGEIIAVTCGDHVIAVSREHRQVLASGDIRLACELVPGDLIPVPGGTAEVTSVTETGKTGPVWCPTAEAGTWLARRDGMEFFTGNKP